MMSRHYPNNKLFIGWLMSLLMLLSPSLLWAATSNALQKIHYKTLENKTLIEFSFSKPLDKSQLQVFSIKRPAKIILDLKQIKNDLGREHEAIDLGVTKNADIVSSGGMTRVVLHLTQLTQYHSKIADNKLTLTIYNVKQSAKKTAQSTKLEDIDFRRTQNGAGQVIITFNQAHVNVNVDKRADTLFIDFLKTHVPERLQRQLDTSDFSTPVKTINTSPEGDNTLMQIRAAGDYIYSSYQSGKQFFIDITPEGTGAAAQAKKKKIYQGKRISLNFQDIKVRAALQLLAEFSGLNIVTNNKVGGSLTLRLEEVPWDQALDIILKTQGLAKRRMGNVILVAPAKELAEQEKQELEAEQEVQALEPVQTELIPINYAKAGDFATLLKQKENSLLSPRGSVTVDDRTNTLIIQDTTSKLAAIRAFIDKLDVAVRQVLIEARIIVVNRDYESQLGVKFSGFGNHKLSFASDLSAQATTSLTNIATLGLAGANLGKNYLIDLELSAMESEGQGNVMASPKLITANQQEALIETGEEIPYLETTSSGAASISFKKAVLSLKVTPQITPDGKIIMALHVTQDSKSSSTAAGGTPIIDTRAITTQVLVNNGETIVLGGVYKQTQNNKITRVPFFGELPVVGNLFKHRSKTDEVQELLIFVTPKIIDDETNLPTSSKRWPTTQVDISS